MNGRLPASEASSDAEACRRREFFLRVGDPLPARARKTFAVIGEGVLGPGHTIERIEEDGLVGADAAAVASLLDEAFSGMLNGRTYLKQLPHARFVARRLGSVVGHVAVLLRAARLGDDVIRLVGVSDLCVAPDHRRGGIGAALVSAILGIGRRSGADVALAFADDGRLYERLGFRRVANPCTLVAVDEHRTLDVRTMSFEDCLMVKPVGRTAWDETATLDLVGHVF